MDTRLEEFSVHGLFGLYSHVIPLNKDNRITAIIGPNGRGKTVCLRLISALFEGNYDYFLEFPYNHIQYKFSSGEIIKIYQNSGETGELNLDTDGIEPPMADSININYTGNGGSKSWKPIILNDPVVRRILARNAPYLERISPNKWIDERDGKVLTSADVIQRHINILPHKFQTRSKEPEEYSDLIKSIDCQLIDTQRLLKFDTEAESPRYFRRHSRHYRSSDFAVNSKATGLKGTIDSTLAEYATLSQSLDRTFPERVLKGKGASNLDKSRLKEQLNELNKRRAQLTTAGILDEESDSVNMPDEKIQDKVAMVLEIYVNDTTKKLNVFDSLLQKITTLTKLISERYNDKHLEVDRSKGIRVVNSDGRKIPLEKLSSGEQHQLILIYDLLFEAKENSLLLIDEPEISLHVSWQRRFIEGLKKIIILNGFDVIFATHSPSLIAEDYDDIAVELGDVEEKS